MVDRSDYGPFRKMSIPYLFFSTGENPDYHRPTDTSDTLDYAKALAATRIIHGVIRQAVDADTLPGWNGTDRAEPGRGDHRPRRAEDPASPIARAGDRRRRRCSCSARRSARSTDHRPRQDHPRGAGRLVMAARLLIMTVL